ncbi:MAG TPA: hypothetical protein VFY49_02870 [Myxococcota bacterium]|nr:hypothetical protein [Myxococcota bacterium]
MKLALIAFAVAVALGLAWHLAARRRNTTWEVGGLYSILSAEGGFSVAKVLALDPGIVSIRIYKQRFPARPETVQPSQLVVGTIHDKDGFGIGHMPVASSTFASWEPRLITRAEVLESELDGYRFWKESGGGVFQ